MATTASTAGPSSDPQRASDHSIPPADGSCPFESLPNELRDIVFDHAYVKIADDELVRPYTKTSGSSTKIYVVAKRSDDLWSVASFWHVWPPFIERFMVSRSWLVGSLTYFYKNSTFCFSNISDFILFVQNSASAYILKTSEQDPNELHLKKVPAESYIATVSGSADPHTMRGLPISKHLETCTGLKNLRFDMDSYFFGASLDKDIEQDEWTTEDFQNFEPTKDLLQIRGLSSLKVEPWCPGWNWDREKNKMLKRNVELFVPLLRKEAVRPRPAPELISPSSPNEDPNQDLHIPFPSPRLKPSPRSSSPIREMLERIARGDAADPFNRPSPSSPPPATPVTSPRWYGDEGLRDEEIPRTKEDFALLLMERGTEVFEWVQSALERLKKVE